MSKVQSLLSLKHLISLISKFNMSVLISSKSTRVQQLQKRVIAFRVFDESHTADNIYMILKTIFEEYKFDNKFLLLILPMFS